ncbi:DUF4145 domain-containing protein [Bacteroides uniformis]|uniref:DUF4145 domain-containing protein n=1 Tax=Bacteroides uniformis TaxID=820 RepID=UPI001AA17B6F|nr:DUF4145 domain-containing protein [Bacteroides uniformis]MBO1691328.1 DUF4145 domain-containing protein [Bacteroides uniformis]
MHIAEIRTVAKSLPLLRLNTHKSLILSYSADFSVISAKKDVAAAFVWLHYRLEEGQECSTQKINSYFEQANLPKYNVTYLKEDLRKHRNILSIKGGGYKPTRTLLLELDAEFNQFLLKTEEVVCEGLILPTSLYENTRGYIETLGKQINASYEHNIYDGCSVLMRRLLEILLIHSYEATGNITVIQDGDGYKNLSVIINDIIQHKRFSLSKEVLSVLDRFRMLGNLSAHKIQYNAKKAYIDEVITLYRVAIEELLYISKIKA